MAKVTCMPGFDYIQGTIGKDSSGRTYSCRKTASGVVFAITKATRAEQTEAQLAQQEKFKNVIRAVNEIIAEKGEKFEEYNSMFSKQSTFTTLRGLIFHYEYDAFEAGGDPNSDPNSDPNGD